MMKLAACALLILLGSGGGVFLSRRYQSRVRQLTKCDGFLNRLQTYLSMEKITTRELFERLSESENFSELTFLKKTADGLAGDVHFPAVWKKSLEESRMELALTGEDYRPLYALGELIGAYDAQSQQQGIDATRALLLEQLADAQEKSRKNGRLFRSLGILSGIAAAILII